MNSPMMDGNTLFTNDKPVDTLTLRELAEWRQTSGPGRLLLPPVQRSVVWTNEQVINYWDSLLRGYPPGMMMVHQVRGDHAGYGTKGRDADGNTRKADTRDYQLFDGQQRMTSILLGMGKGQMADKRKIWIDLGTKPNSSSGLKYQLRMNSNGQPFGYRTDAPNQKIELGKRQDKWKDWRTKYGEKTSSPKAFDDAKGSDIIDATCAITLSDIFDLLSRNRDIEETICELEKRERAERDLVHSFVKDFEAALKREVVLFQLDQTIVKDQEEYLRFFERLGQGGTRLSDDELTYSTIKHHYPSIHDHMKEIMERKVGRLAGEVDMVLAALRVAKTLHPWKGAREWEIIGRPTPAFVSQLKDREEVRSKFFELIPDDERGSLLLSVLSRLREALSYDRDNQSTGLPGMLLARMPHQLFDVLLLLSLLRGVDRAWTGEESEKLRAFVLYWMLFVKKNDKAAWHVFLEGNSGDNAKHFHKNFIPRLVEKLETETIAYYAPRLETLTKMRGKVKEEGHWLHSWGERFVVTDRDGEQDPGETLRVISTSRERIQRALMWLQIDYIATKFPNYDPTSGRDEDLPVDLDHIVPAKYFAFHWKSYRNRLADDVETDEAIRDNFRERRGIVGNSLGNMRWLAASENRSRGEGALADGDGSMDLVYKRDDWNKLFDPEVTDSDRKWSRSRIASFQKLIDLRTLDLVEKLISESGIARILPLSHKDSSS